MLTLRRATPAGWVLRGLAPASAASTPADFTHTLVRAADQLQLRFEFIHLARSGNSLVQGTAGDPLIRIVFGSQHTAEETVAGSTPGGGGVGHRSAGPSRIVVAVDPGSLPMDFTTDALLDLADFALALDARTEEGQGGGPNDGPPDEDVTAIELPEGLVISPDAASRFTAATAPVTFNGVSEVWRARLGTSGVDGVEEPPDGSPIVRALAETSGADAFDRALIKDHRDEIVEATTDYGNASYPNNEPLSVQRLWLTPAGGYLDLTGDWADGNPAGLLSLLIKATTGRDVEVRVAERGFLAPFGHPATIVSVSERQWLEDADGDLTSVLVKEEYLTIKSSTVNFDAAHFRNGGCLWPFASATITNSVEDVPISKQTIPGAPDAEAWVVIDDTTGNPLEIDCVLTDHLGNELDIGPLGVTFAANDHAQNLGGGGPIDEIIDFYLDDANLEPFRTAGSNGGVVAFAGTNDDERRLTEVDCTEITIQLAKPVGTMDNADIKAAGIPAFLPRLTNFKIRPEELSTTGTGLPPAITASYTNDWRDHAFGEDNPGLTYIELATPFDASFDSEGRALAKPALTVDTLSLALGAGFEPPPPNSTWDPAEVIPDGATLLGVIDLRDIVKLVNVGSDVATTEGIPHVETILEPASGVPDRARLIFDWTSPLQSSGVFVAAADLASEGLPVLLNPPTELDMRVEQVIPFDGGDPSTEIDLSVSNFALRLPVDPVVIVYFSKVEVNVPGDGPLSFDPQVEAIRFDGTLAFLEPLQQFMNDLLGFTIEVDTDAIVGSVGFTLPDLVFGVVNVRNASLNLALDLPLDGDVPTVNLDLGTRESPVSVTVLGIGGSAFFGVGVAAREDPFEYLELWLGVVLEAEVNFVIGSAGVRLDIGAGIEISGGGKVVVITGYVSLKGAVEILGFTVLSVGVEATLVYKVAPQLLTGTLEIVIGALFGAEFRASIEATVDLGDGGGGIAAPSRSSRALGALGAADAHFGDRHTKNTWETYCDAFAGE